MNYKTLARPAFGAILLLHFIGCGTILHPERKGQRQGRIDAGIAVLDGLGLVLGIIPGIIAFAVDFTNGTIYLPPGGGKSSRFASPREPALAGVPTSDGMAGIRRVRFDPRSGVRGLEETLARETGRPIRLGRDGARLMRLESAEEIPARLRLLAWR